MDNEFENKESMDDYAKELEASLRKIYPGDVMDCTVVAVDETCATVDLDYYAPGKIYLEEMSADPTFSIMYDVHVGDTFKAVVLQRDDGAGNIILSKKAGDLEYSWEKLEQMLADKTIINGTITDTTRSGAIMYVEGIRGFIPASKLDLKYVEDTSGYLGKKVSVQIFEVDKAHQRLILTARDILTEKAMEERTDKISHMMAGTIVSGTVEKLMNYGAFVKIQEGISGLLHISEITDGHIDHPGAVLKVGQQIDVMITKIDGSRISLSLKAANAAKEQELNEEASEYKSEPIANNPFADLLKDFINK
ncbi:MAG: S1 RNA-binding domain-containing protein [Lachnospiraceae bacterium]|nr:S1 RNA-binding domain-containing protein [Lachnospiraceae bacterium]